MNPVVLIFVLGMVTMSLGATQGFQGGNQNQNRPEEKYPPMPYQFEYEVNDPPSKSYYGHEEAQNDGGRTDGKYFVWLPDGRLMTVTYYVEGNSGFVPKITFSDSKFSPPPPTHQLGGTKGN